MPNWFESAIFLRTMRGGFSATLPAETGVSDAILAERRASTGDYLDRQAVERLFGAAERRARQLMDGLPSVRIGNAAAVQRTALIGSRRSRQASVPKRKASSRAARNRRAGFMVQPMEEALDEFQVLIPRDQRLRSLYLTHGHHRRFQ
jgi:hypothetical protein